LQLLVTTLALLLLLLLLFVSAGLLYYFLSPLCCRHVDDADSRQKPRNEVVGVKTQPFITLSVFHSLEYDVTLQSAKNEAEKDTAKSAQHSAASSTLSVVVDVDLQLNLAR
jgi:hypothetical protein